MPELTSLGVTYDPPVLVCNFQFSRKSKKSPLAQPREAESALGAPIPLRGAARVAIFWILAKIENCKLKQVGHLPGRPSEGEDLRSSKLLHTAVIILPVLVNILQLKLQINNKKSPLARAAASKPALEVCFDAAGLREWRFFSLAKMCKNICLRLAGRLKPPRPHITLDG